MLSQNRSLIRTIKILATGALCLGGVGYAQEAAGTTDADRLRRLEAAVRQLQEENRELRQRVPGLASAGDKPIFVQPTGRETKLKLGGFIQGNAESGDVSSFEGRLAGGPNAVSNRFRLRRARLNVTGEFAEHFDFKLEGDFQQSDGTAGGRTGFAATDLFLNWNQFPAANVKAGQFKAPFGLEQTTSDTTLFIAERTLATGALTPERQIGVQLWGKPLASLGADKKDLLSYAVGVFNGNGRNTTVNDNNKFLYAARLESLAYGGKFSGQPVKLKLGLNGLFSRDGANVNLSPAGNLQVQADGSLAAFSTHTPDERRAWGADASLTVGPFDLVAEYLEERIRPTISSPNFSGFTASGYYVQGSYYLWANQLQAVARWDSFNPGQVANDDLDSATAGLNYYIRGNDLKLMFDYIHTRSDFRRANPRFGKDEFDQVLARIQLLF